MDIWIGCVGSCVLDCTSAQFPHLLQLCAAAVARTFKFNVPVVTAVTWGQAGDTLEIVAR